MKNAMYQVVYWEDTHLHETRVFADDELNAECKVADRHPNGYGFWAIASKDVANYPNSPHSTVWHGSY